jgi:hypothetical protein
MSADDFFKAAVTIVREVVNKRSLELTKSQVAFVDACDAKPRDITQVDLVAIIRKLQARESEFAAPYLARIEELQSDVRHLCENNASYVEGAIRLTTKLMASEERIAKLEVENKSLREQSRLGADELHDLGLGTRDAS